MGRYLKFDEKLQKIPEKVHSKKDRIEIILGVSLLVACGFSYFVLDAFGEEMFLLDCPENSYHGLDNQGNAACRDIQTNQILEPVSVTIVDSNSDETRSNSGINIFQETGWLQDMSFLIGLTLFILVIGLIVIILRKARRRTPKSRNNDMHAAQLNPDQNASYTQQETSQDAMEPDKPHGESEIVDTSDWILMPDSNVLVSVLGEDNEGYTILGKYFEKNIHRVRIPNLIVEEIDGVLRDKEKKAEGSEDKKKIQTQWPKFESTYRDKCFKLEKPILEYMTKLKDIHQESVDGLPDVRVSAKCWIRAKMSQLIQKKYIERGTDIDKISKEGMMDLAQHLCYDAKKDRTIVAHALVLAEEKPVYLLTSDFDIWGFKEEFDSLGDITIINPDREDLQK